MSARRLVSRGSLYTIILAVLIIAFIRVLLIDSVNMADSSMEQSLHKGDKILVNKATYGIRLPITILSIPFVHNKLFDKKSYSSSIEFPYTRLGKGSPKKNDIVLFNNPLDTIQPIDKKDLLINRCIGLPGDKIEKNKVGFYINSEIYIPSPNLKRTYKLNVLAEADLQLSNTLLHLGVDTAKIKGLELELTNYQYHILKDKLGDQLHIELLGDDKLYYDLTVPYQSYTLKLNRENIAIYSASIILDSKNEIYYLDGKLINSSNSSEIQEYTYLMDYYWLMSDNRMEAWDSEHIGFVPFSHIIGRVSYIWSASSERTSEYSRFISSSYN